MKPKQTFGNNVLIKLDKVNDSIKLKNGTDLYVDTTFEPEKHITVTGEVFGIPSRLYYSGIPNKGMPWKTPIEIKLGDRVVMYYLAVQNCFRKEMFRAIVEGEDRYIFIQYHNIYAIVRDGVLMPINGYVLVEPCENPEWNFTRERLNKLGLAAVKLNEKSNVDVVYGIVRYFGRPNDAYTDGKSDDGVGVNYGDIVVMKRITDLPLEYDLHAKIDGGKKYWRTQRKNILAIYEKPV